MRFPLIASCVLFSLYLVWSTLDLPEKGELILILKDYIARYGLWLVFIGSFLEALLLIGWYFPGSSLIFLSVILAPSPLHAILSVAIVTLGLFCGYTINFFLGKYGWYRLLVFFGIKKQVIEAKEKLTKHGLKAVFLSYWNPGLASFTSTAAGVLQFKPSRFLLYSLMAVSLWDAFWGTVAYNLGEKVFDTILTWPFIISIILVWAVIRYNEKRREAKKDA